LQSSNNISTDFITTPYYIEGLYIEPSQSIIIENNDTRHVQPKVMEVLTYLCSKAEQLVTTDELIKACWPNQFISDSPLHKCIAQIRKALSDDPKNPRFIKTVPKKGYVFIAKVKGLNVTPQKSTTHWAGEIPYPGLQPFTSSQSDIFFGREQVIKDINNWAAQINQDAISWLSLSAPIGAGKSSLVYAGLLPTLTSHAFINTTHKEFCNVLDLRLLLASQKPHIELLTLLLNKEKLSNRLSLAEYDELITAHHSNSTENQLIALFDEQLLITDKHHRFVIFIDHLEALFDLYSKIKISEHELTYFFKLLQLLVSSKKCFLITCVREQFSSKLEQVAAQHKHAFNYELPPFSHTELIDIIDKPAELAGISFEYNVDSRERLNRVIIQELQIKPAPIAMVQLLLNQLYTQKSNQIITYKAYKKINGIAGCIASIAEEKYQKLTIKEQTSFEQVLFHLITLDASGHIANNEQPCLIEYFTDDNKLSVINHFISVGILQVTYINANAHISLVNDSLLIAWSRIILWIKKNISTLYTRHDLKIATQRWLYHEKSSHLLIHSNTKIKIINSMVDSNNFTISDDEKGFIAASVNNLKRANLVRKTVVATFLICSFSLAWLSVSLSQTNEKITTTRNNAENLISFIIYDLKDKLEPLGKLELLNIVADKTLEYFELAGTYNLTGKALLQWAESLHILGEVNISKNNYATAKSYFEQTATALKQALKSDNTNEKLLELYMLANYWLGYSAYLQSDYIAAEPFWVQYKTYADILFSLSPKPKWQLEQSYALNNLGSLAEKNNQLNAASNYFEQSAAIKLSLLKTQPNNLSLRVDLADTRSWQSNIQAKSGKLLISIKYLEEALSQLKQINHTENNFKHIEDLAYLEHNVAKLYYNSGDLLGADTHSQAVQKNLLTLVNNDDNNYAFKESLLGSYLLSIQIFINHNKSDQALIYLDKSKILINRLKSSESKTTDLILININLLQYQAQAMALLKQNQSALISITNAIELFKEHLSIKTHTTFYARLLLTKWHVLNTTKNIDNTALKKELIEIKDLIESKLQRSNPDYKTLSIYLTILSSMQQSSADNPWLKIYQHSDYNIPEYSISNLK
jgi:DNA-binding winged helix-turn-helix (wHTH) protein